MSKADKAKQRREAVLAYVKQHPESRAADAAQGATLAHPDNPVSVLQAGGILRTAVYRGECRWGKKCGGAVTYCYGKKRGV